MLDCQHDNKSFSCIPKADLNEGLNKVTATIKDSSDREVTVEWSFSVISENAVSSPVNGTTNEETVIILGREIPRNVFNIILIICCIAGLLILIPWVLYLLWNGRRKTDEETTVETKTSYDFDQPIETKKEVVNTITPVDTSNYYTPENYSYPGYTYTPEPVTTETTQTVTTEESKPAPIPEAVTTTSLAEEKTPIATPEVKVEEKVETTPLVTNTNTIDDYYSYVNPTGDVEPTVTPTTEGDIPTSTEVKTTTGQDLNTSTDTYVEPKETD